MWQHWGNSSMRSMRRSPAIAINGPPDGPTWSPRCRRIFDDHTCANCSKIASFDLQIDDDEHCQLSLRYYGFWLVLDSHTLFQLRMLSQPTVLTEFQVTGLSTYGGDAVSRMFILEKVVWEFFMRNHSVHILYGIFHGGPKDGSWILPGTWENCWPRLLVFDKWLVLWMVQKSGEKTSWGWWGW